ncbi:MAG: Myosin type-2 heavy chain 1 [Chaenotheca gracillima]|nr:MAG: Myosin type-2 heavy chain 1 [Chaenotheca gracillima]
MAHDEVFAGPMSESVPSSITSFAHRRSRADSTASFTYLQESEEPLSTPEEEAVLDDEEEDEEFHADDNDQDYSDPSVDLEAGELSPLRRKSSAFSRASVEHPLLDRLDSSASSIHGRGGRLSQKIYLHTEDLTIVIAGFTTNPIGYAIYIALCVATAGLGYLLFRWLPRWRVRLVGRATGLREASWTVIENQWGEFTIHNVNRERYDRVLSTVFGAPGKLQRMQDYDEDDDPVLRYLRFLDYRYIRFCFHPLKDKFILNNSWKDPNWTDVKTIRVGIDSDEKSNRELVFGQNQIDIEQKTIPQLLVDEAFHPFYIFQLASLILWSLDQYYYYAVCIFTISLVSITTTLIETRATMRRLREISRFECDVRVKRSGFWRNVASTELVPGDIYEVSDPSLGQFPCDSLLLSGDCIVNESMLTGESVPVSKIPAGDEALEKVDLSASSILPEVAKHFLFCGTKIIRARRPHDNDDEEAVALAMVLRTGFNTTKGALVRSMLFPKPSGFKFYRDSFRYISVMAGIAMLGFVASFINFVRLEVSRSLPNPRKMTDTV